MFLDGLVVMLVGNIENLRFIKFCLQAILGRWRIWMCAKGFIKQVEVGW